MIEKTIFSETKTSGGQGLTSDCTIKEEEREERIFSNKFIIEIYLLWRLDAKNKLPARSKKSKANQMVALTAIANDSTSKIVIIDRAMNSDSKIYLCRMNPLVILAKKYELSQNLQICNFFGQDYVMNQFYNKL